MDDSVRSIYLLLFSYDLYQPVELSVEFASLWIAVAVLLFYSSMTAFNVPHHSLGAELSPNYHERTKVFGFVIWFGTVVPFGPLAMHQLIVGNNPKKMHSTSH